MIQITVGIYKIVNNVNNKAYIGQSINIHKRWIKHICDLRGGNHRNTHLQYAWNKYGEDNFKITIVEECDISQLDTKEIKWIKLLNTTDSSIGYNKTPGGSTTVISDETKRKISESLKLRNLGKTHYMCGRKASDETRKRQSESHKKRKRNIDLEKHIGSNNGNSKYSNEQILEVIKLLSKGKTPTETSIITGVTRNVVFDVFYKKNWTHLTKDVVFPIDNSKETAALKIIDLLMKGLSTSEIVTIVGTTKNKVNQIKHKRTWKHLTSDINFAAS